MNTLLWISKVLYKMIVIALLLTIVEFHQGKEWLCLVFLLIGLLASLLSSFPYDESND